MNNHPCTGKCSEFKEGGQCFYCLITEHRIDHIVEPNDMVDDTHIENNVSLLIERLKAENKMLHKAAATHRRNQKHYMDLYHRLVEQLYPYALDLNEPVDTYSSKEYTDGYNRARAFIHYDLMEMMESDEEYICVQCDMLGGEG